MAGLFRRFSGLVCKFYLRENLQKPWFMNTLHLNLDGNNVSPLFERQ
jgi:hypothetical protein